MGVPGTQKAFTYVVDTSGSDRVWIPLEQISLNDDTVNPITTPGEFVGAAQYVFDERTLRYVRVRGNRSAASLLASASRTATTNSARQTNRNWRGAHFTINVTAFAGTGLIPHIQGEDPVIGVFYDVLIGTAITATGVVTIKVYPGIGQIPGGAASDLLPYNWRFQMEHTDAVAKTYQVHAQLNI